MLAGKNDEQPPADVTARLLTKEAARLIRESAEVINRTRCLLMESERLLLNSEAAGMLQRAGLITYAWGRPKVLNDGLAAGSCECYPLMEAQFDWIFEQRWRPK